MPEPATLTSRFRRLPAAPDDRLVAAPGTMADYHALAEHHYRAGRPATVLRVLTLRDPRPTAAGRFTGRRSDGGPAAVLVESLPSLACRMRDWAMRERFGSWLPVKQRALMLNEEVRCVSRVIVHPQWRGAGLAVRLVRWALDEAETPFTEALAAMGRVNPFFERAGMTAYARPMHACDARLTAALRRCGLSPTDLAALTGVWRHVDALPADDRAWLLDELRRWHRQNGGRSANHDRDPRVHLHAAQQRLLLEPVYYLHDNRSQEGADDADD